MLIRTWIRSWAKWLSHESPSLIGEILVNPSNREALLGVQRLTTPTPELIKQDIERMIHYANTDGYKVWAEEAWTQAISCIDKLMDDSLEPIEVDFYRGSLKQTLELLRISYKARQMKEESIRRSKENQI